jgi:uridine kinase
MTVEHTLEGLPVTNGIAPFAASTWNHLAAPFVIGIAGGSGAGKTTIVEKLSAQLSGVRVSVLDQDSYYRDCSHMSRKERDAVNFDDPSALDHDLLILHLEQLRLGNPITKPVYCFATHTRTREVTVIEPAPLVMVEGIFALHDPRLRSLMDLKLYIDADPDLRFIRRLMRDIVDRGRTPESVITQYLETVRPMHLQHIHPTRRYADLVVDGTGSIGPALRKINKAIHGASGRSTSMTDKIRESLAVR